MKRLAVMGMATIAVVAASTAVPSSIAVATETGTSERLPVNEAALGQLTERFLDARNEAVVQPRSRDTASPTDVVAMTAPFTELLTSNLAVLEDRRANLEEVGEAYSTAHTDVTVNSAELLDDKVVLDVTEHTALDYVKIAGDEPENTEYVLDHEITYVSDGSGQWLLAEDSVAPDMVAPITIVVSDVPGAPDDPAPGLYEPDNALGSTSGTRVAASQCGVANGCDATDAVDSSATEFAPSLIEQLPYPAEPKVSIPEVATYVGTNVNAAGPPPGMNYGAMVNYALTYWSTYNTNYRSFNNDCTNFISQVLRRGGWDYDNGWYRSNNNWWYNSWNQTYSWAGAENWSRFAPRRTTWLDNVWRQMPSDIMQMDFDRNGNKNHSMVATARNSNGQIYFTYHTTNTKNRSLSSILNSYPNAWYYAYRT